MRDRFFLQVNKQSVSPNDSIWVIRDRYAYSHIGPMPYAWTRNQISAQLILALLNAEEASKPRSRCCRCCRECCLHDECCLRADRGCPP
jgi:hypothetical protein